MASDKSECGSSARTVRTTVTLAADVRDAVAQYSKARGISFTQGLNQLVRVGLAREQSLSTETFQIRARPIGLRAGLSYDSIEELLDFAEGPRRR